MARAALVDARVDGLELVVAVGVGAHLAPAPAAGDLGVDAPGVGRPDVQFGPTQRLALAVQHPARDDHHLAVVGGGHHAARGVAVQVVGPQLIAPGDHAGGVAAVGHAGRVAHLDARVGAEKSGPPPSAAALPPVPPLPPVLPPAPPLPPVAPPCRRCHRAPPPVPPVRRCRRCPRWRCRPHRRCRSSRPCRRRLLPPVPAAAACPAGAAALAVVAAAHQVSGDARARDQQQSTARQPQLLLRLWRFTLARSGHGSSLLEPSGAWSGQVTFSQIRHWRRSTCMFVTVLFTFSEQCILRLTKHRTAEVFP